MTLIFKDHQRVGLWIAERTHGEWREGGKCIGLEKDGNLVAGVLYDYWNGSSIYAHIAVDGPINRDFLREIFRYPFVQLQCNVILGLVPSSNEKARQFDEHLGFKLLVDIPGGHPDGSLRIYFMRKEDCRFLGDTRNVKAKSAAAA